MWIAVVLAMFGSLFGFTQLSSQTEVARVADTSRAMALAANMTSYRAGVTRYANANKTFTGEVTMSALTSYFPTGHVMLDPPLWRNHVLGDGTILVYADTAPDASITDAIATVSRHSVLAGQADTVTGKVIAKGAADMDRATLPAMPPGMYLHDRTPVWLGHRE